VTWIQRELRLEPRPRGFHLVTEEVVRAVPELERFEVGIAHVFIRHTSAALTLNENASPAVRRDFRSWVDSAVPEDADYWTHTLEGPIAGGRLALGTWQGIYLCEHRDSGGAREVVVTAWGDERSRP